MFDLRWRRLSLLLVMPAAAAVAGCGGSGSQGTTGQGAADGAAAQAGVVAQTGAAAYSAAQLRGALLGKINGAAAALPAESGSYSSLPEVRATKQSMRGVQVTPPECAQTSAGGFNSPALADSPAAVVTFRVAGNGVSEVLVAPSQAAAMAALGKQVPAGCEHYVATVGGKTFRYSVRESYVSGIGDQARVLNVKAAGYEQLNVWSVVYRAHKFVGAVTVVGPDASESTVRQLGKESYTDAVKSLS